ncbi:MAG TPA: TMEM175 family protein [Anaerolineaceae bacterium]|nr:TMEM175 family protein [Anaerolineaceae bacterium]
MIRRLINLDSTTSPTGFRWRGGEPSRLEGLSDTVFGFALTLLVVSLEVPQTFDELLQSIRGFFAFALTFGLLIVIWYEHYTYFRRYGLKDSYVIVWNTVLLFLIVFYVYPLKFLFTLFMAEVFGTGFEVTLPGGELAPMIRDGQLQQLYVIFGIGWSAVWLVFVLLYRRALQMGKALHLSPLEVFETRASITENLAAAGVGLVSIALALVSATTNAAGWVYLAMFPLTWAIRRRVARRRPLVESPPAPVEAGE